MDRRVAGFAVVAQDRLDGGHHLVGVDRFDEIGVSAACQPLGAVAHVDRDLSAVCGVVSDPGISDRSKIALLLSRFPPLRDAPLADLVRRVEGDAETHALLETIGDDERASLGWLRRMSEALAREGT